MKLQYKLSLIAAGLLTLGSCANHDLIPEIANVGQPVPAAYWELGSTVCKAGESFTFQGKYNVEPGRTPSRSEVWYQIGREDVAAATVKLGGASLSYTKSETVTDTMRTYQCLAQFPHAEATWDGYEFIIVGSVPVSRTLSPVTWVDITAWDQDRFDQYYPSTFRSEFINTVLGYLTDEATASSYYSALRTVYLNYPFTNEQMTAVGLPEVDMTKDDQGTSEKSDLWFSTTEASDAAHVGNYYVRVNEDGSSTYVEVGLDYTGTETVYPVYKSAPWVFCRYDDNSGSIVSTVRLEWLPKFRTLLENVAFEEWIYDSANACYKVEFSRKYMLNTQFRVYDTDENEGIASDRFKVDIN